MEYHVATTTEPLTLNDQIVSAAFNRSEIGKIAERGKLEIFTDIANRFGLSKERFSQFTNVERFALWHGEKV